MDFLIATSPEDEQQRGRHDGRVLRPVGVEVHRSCAERDKHTVARARWVCAPDGLLGVEAEDGEGRAARHAHVAVR